MKNIQRRLALGFIAISFFATTTGLPNSDAQRKTNFFKSSASFLNNFSKKANDSGIPHVVTGGLILGACKGLLFDGGPNGCSENLYGCALIGATGLCAAFTLDAGIRKTIGGTWNIANRFSSGLQLGAKQVYAGACNKVSTLRQSACDGVSALKQSFYTKIGNSFGKLATWMQNKENQCKGLPSRPEPRLQRCMLCLEDFIVTDEQFRLTKCCHKFICAKDLAKVQTGRVRNGDTRCPTCRAAKVSGFDPNDVN